MSLDVVRSSSLPIIATRHCKFLFSISRDSKLVFNRAVCAFASDNAFASSLDKVPEFELDRDALTLARSREFSLVKSSTALRAAAAEVSARSARESNSSLASPQPLTRSRLLICGRFRNASSSSFRNVCSRCVCAPCACSSRALCVSQSVDRRSSSASASAARSSKRAARASASAALASAASLAVAAAARSLSASLRAASASARSALCLSPIITSSLRASVAVALASAASTSAAARATRCAASSAAISPARRSASSARASATMLSASPLLDALCFELLRALLDSSRALASASRSVFAVAVAWAAAFNEALDFSRADFVSSSFCLVSSSSPSSSATAAFGVSAAAAAASTETASISRITLSFVFAVARSVKARSSSSRSAFFSNSIDLPFFTAP
mmetsp:Transcript_3936/g.14518  ORF Transcript_3936/g.14518 Transcript_3936/m.14518 type:complete len:393 (+) Transcript_3936:296-1474(+)